MKKINNFLIGSDPEFFLQNKVSGEFVSAEGLIGGTKEEPKQINKKGYYVQEDNVMVELNTPPTRSPKTMFEDVNYIIDYIRDVLPQDVDISNVASAEFPKGALQTKQAKAFGCDPDFDAWSGEANNPPSADTNLRTAGRMSALL